MKTTTLFIAALLSVGMLLISQKATSQNTKSLKVVYTQNTAREIRNDNPLKKSVKSLMSDWTKSEKSNSVSTLEFSNSAVMEELEDQVKFRPAENIDDFIPSTKEESLDSLVNALAEEVKYRPGEYFE